MILIIAAVSVISAIIIFVIFLLYSPSSEPEEAIEQPEAVHRSGMLYFNSLNYNQQLVYDQIKEAAEQTASYTEQFIADIDRDSFIEAVRALYADNPALFYVDYEELELRESEDGRKLVRMKYNASRSEITEMKAALEEKAAEITERAGKYIETYDKELFLHDYITENTTLVAVTSNITAENNDDTENKTLNTEFADNIYGVIVEGVGDVKGYALAMKYLMNECSEHCFLVFGKLAGGEEHVWNLVYINDKFYHTDVAWDDADISYSELKFHAYFNLSETVMTVSRSLSDPELIPAAESENDYYAVSGLVAASEYELKEIVCREIYKACREQREYIELLPTYTDELNNIRAALETAFRDAADELNKNGIGIIVTSGTDNSTENSGINAKTINLRSAFRIYQASTERNALTIQLFYD